MTTKWIHVLGVLFIIGLLGCVQQPTGNMNQNEALQIARASVCVQEGPLKENTIFYNDVTQTWWIDLDVQKTGCSPACVVNAVTRTAEVNWRCTGLIPPSGP